MDKKTASQGLLALSVLSVLVAGVDYFTNLALFNLGADSWMLVGISLGVYTLVVKQWS